MWKKFFTVRRRIRRRRKSGSSKHYREHKEASRAYVSARLEAINAEHYRFTYHRVAIRDQKSRWGSCSKKGNLNFNYRLMFLPPHLADYVIVHELAHLQEFNHGKGFWELVEKADPEYKKHKAELSRTRIAGSKTVLIS